MDSKFKCTVLARNGKYMSKGADGNSLWEPLSPRTVMYDAKNDREELESAYNSAGGNSEGITKLPVTVSFIF